jgi:hypothetical protein
MYVSMYVEILQVCMYVFGRKEVQVMARELRTSTLLTKCVCSYLTLCEYYLGKQ